MVEALHALDKDIRNHVRGIEEDISGRIEDLRREEVRPLREKIFGNGERGLVFDLGMVQRDIDEIKTDVREIRDDGKLANQAKSKRDWAIIVLLLGLVFQLGYIILKS